MLVGGCFLGLGGAIADNSYLRSIAQAEILNKLTYVLRLVYRQRNHKNDYAADYAR